MIPPTHSPPPSPTSRSVGLLLSDLKPLKSITRLVERIVHVYILVRTINDKHVFFFNIQDYSKSTNKTLNHDLTVIACFNH